MFGDLAGTHYDAPIQTLFDMSAESPADTGSCSSRILSITSHGDVATATVAEDGYWGTVSFLDLLSLCRIDGAGCCAASVRRTSRSAGPTAVDIGRRRRPVRTPRRRVVAVLPLVLERLS